MLRHPCRRANWAAAGQRAIPGGNTLGGAARWRQMRERRGPPPLPDSGRLPLRKCREGGGGNLARMRCRGRVTHLYTCTGYTGYTSLQGTQELLEGARGVLTTSISTMGIGTKSPARAEVQQETESCLRRNVGHRTKLHCPHPHHNPLNINTTLPSK